MATDASRISDSVLGFGGKAVLTSPDHVSGSDRIAEAADILGLDNDAMIINVQGDEPDMPPALINQVAGALGDDPAASMATASAAVDDESQLDDPSVVKVVCDQAGYAIYFSRATIPWVRSDGSSAFVDHAITVVRRHLGIYAYRAGYIRTFASRDRCELEALEKLEQLRSIWYGDRIRCVEAAETPGPGIDTSEDLERARQDLSPD